MENHYFWLGFVTSISLGCVLGMLAWLHKRKNGSVPEYDERQVASRGKAFQAGFFSALILSAACTILDYVGALPGEPLLWHFGALLLSILVCSLTAIHFDAYIGMNQAPAKIIRSGLIIAVALLLIGARNLSSPRAENRTVGILNLMIAAMWAILLLALLVHRWMAKEHAE